MSVSRKLFIAMASFIVGMSVVYAIMTQVVVKEMVQALMDVDRREEIEALSSLFVDYYQNNDHSWKHVQQVKISDAIGEGRSDASVILLSPDQKLLYVSGTENPDMVKALGIQSRVEWNGEAIALLYYYDQDLASLIKLRYGVRDAAIFFMLAGAVIFVFLSLLVAYRLSRWLTAPLRVLMPAIDRLGKGELGIQAPVISKDEYGTVTSMFNEMSHQLKRAEDIRRHLVADVAHELRTPLTIIQGKLDLIQQSGETIQPESLLPLQDEVIRLTRLVEDLHQLSLAEAKRLPLDPKPTDISDLLQRILDRIQSDADAKGVHLTLTSLTDASTIQVDPNRITQVFLNLLVNAVRYTPSGGKVTTTVEEEPKQNGKCQRLRITVADTGIGIEADQLPFLFNRFYRTDQARTRNKGGTGLGLAIAKEFVQAHNGTIEVESQPGQGTTFIVTLPAEWDSSTNSNQKQTGNSV